MSTRRAIRPPDRPSFAQLCMLAHHAFDRLGEEIDPSEVTDALKWDCARAGLAYDTTALSAATEAVRCARQKGYRTRRITSWRERGHAS